MSLFDLIQADSPLVISVPHDGALIPDDIQAVMNPDVLNSSDRDYLIGEVFEFTGLAYSKIQANYSRHVIDLNRPADGKALYENQAETELCPTSTFDLKAIYQDNQTPDRSEVQSRIATYWQPYHDQLADLIQKAKDRYGYCVLIDAHSIDDEVPRFFDGRLPDINVGTNSGKSCSHVLETLLLKELSAQHEFTSVSNGRFKGGFITRHYGQPDIGVHAIQLEHAKSCYLNEELKLSERAVFLRQFWQDLLEKFILKMK